MTGALETLLRRSKRVALRTTSNIIPGAAGHKAKAKGSKRKGRHSREEVEEPGRREDLLQGEAELLPGRRRRRVLFFR